MALGLDFAGGRPSAASIARAGYSFVPRYLSSGGPGLPGKLLLPEEVLDYRAHGVDIVSNWETLADRMRGGYSAGIQDATAALAHVLACGGPADRPIYFSADWDASEGEQDDINDYLRAAGTVIGPENVGIYGGYWVVRRALDAGVARWAWQTVAWSGGNQDPRINIMQRNDLGYEYVDGIECDINESRTADYGQWSRAGSEQPAMSPSDDELTKLFPSRSIYRAGDQPIDTLAGLILNIDARLHEMFVAEQAKRGVPGYLELVQAVAANGIAGSDLTGLAPDIVADSKARAQAVVDEINRAAS